MRGHDSRSLYAADDNIFVPYNMAGFDAIWSILFLAGLKSFRASPGDSLFLLADDDAIR